MDGLDRLSTLGIAGETEFVELAPQTDILAYHTTCINFSKVDRFSMNANTEKESTVAKGLKGVTAADTSICLVNGKEGRLLYRGYDIDSLARTCRFEEVAYLLFQGELPKRDQLDDFQKLLVQHRKLHPEVMSLLRSIPRDTHPMAALRTAVALAGVYDPQVEENSEAANYEKSIRLTSMMATIVAAFHRLRQGQEPVEADPTLSHSANFMYMLNDRKPSDDEIKAMDLILILHAEHGLNASTFAGRVIIATLTDIYSAVTGAIGALKGKLHGGANTEVLKTLKEIDSVDRVDAWVDEVRSNKGKFMGFGHAVYQTEDPRAKHLKGLSKRLGEEKGDPKWYEMSARMEEIVTQAINKNCNVDFYSASLQHYMGIPGDLFTCIFGTSRIVGWCAHILEQLQDNKIIRPSANYIGPAERHAVPIAER